jgi:outer membrane protein
MRLISYMNIGFSWILLLFCMPALSQERHNFTAKDCIAYAKKNNPQVRSALINVDIQRQVNKQVTAAALPGVNGYGTYTNNVKLATQLIPAEFTGGAPGTFIPLQFGTRHLATGGVNVQQILFDGQVFTGLKARKTVIDVQQKAVDLTEEVINANIYKIYYQLVASKTQIALLDSNIARLQKLLNDTKIIYQNGFAEQVDVNKTTVQLTNLQTEKVNVVNSIEGGYLGLRVLIGMPARDTLVLTEDITDEKIRSAALTDSSYRYEDRKEYQLLELTRKLRDFNIQRYRLSAIPTLALNGTYSYTAFSNRFANLTKTSQDWFPAGSFSVSLNIPIFNGFRRVSQVQQARLERQQTLVSIDSVKLGIDRDVAQAKLDYATAITSLNYQKSNVSLATLVYDQTKKKYEIGTGSQTEINAAQGDLQLAQTNYINSLYNAINARVDYLRAVGRLDDMGR